MRQSSCLLVAALLVAGCGPSGDPQNVADFCRELLSGSGGPWQVAVEVDHTLLSSLALTSGQKIAVCQGGKNNQDEWHGAGKAVTSQATTPQALTYAAMVRDDPSASVSPPSALAGRVPDGTARVRVVLAGGATVDAALGGGLWLAWPVPADEPVAVEALDSSGAVLGRIADPAGVQPQP